MADQLQLRGGTTNEHSTFTGALREVTVDTDKDTLIVHDAATAGGHPLLREDGSNSALSLGTAGTPSIKFTGDTNTGIYSPGADQVAISTGGTGRLFVDANGNAALGTSSPNNYSGFSTFTFNGSNGGEIDFEVGGTLTADIFGNSAGLHLGTRLANDVITFSTNSGTFSEKMRIDSSGRLLVGTSSYTTVGNGATLQVKGDGSAASSMSLIRTAAGGPEFHFAAGSSGTNIGNNNGLGFLKFLGYHTNGYDEYARIQAYVDGTNGDGDAPGRLVFSTTADGASSPTERMRIDSSGRVGVGTTSPTNVLHVRGSNQQLQLQDSNTDDRFQVRMNSGWAEFLTAGSDNSARPYRFRQYNTDVLVIDSSGRVGVGTSSPSAPLHVSGNMYAGASIVATSDTTGLNWYNNLGLLRIQQDTSNTGYCFDVYKGGTNAVKIGFKSDGSAYFAGNVGVGTTSPSEALHVKSTSSTQLVLERDGTTTQIASVIFKDGSGDQNRISSSDSNLIFGTGASNTERLRIDSSGRVGIGTSSPVGQTYIAGPNSTNFGVAADAALNIAAAGGSLSGRRVNLNFAVVPSATNAAAAIALEYQQQSGFGNGALIFGTRDVTTDTAPTERMRITNTGNVGIGTTSPAYELEVAGSAAFGASGVAGQVKARRPSDGLVGGYFGYATTGSNDLYISNASGSQNIIAQTNVGAFIFNSASATERARIDSSGRLLVGTSTARAIGQSTSGHLQVEGTDNTALIAITRNGNEAGGPVLALGKSRGTTVGSNTVVQSNDTLGLINFAGADGTDIQTVGARIGAQVDGTPGANDMPGRLVFSTTADGASSPTERMRIAANGRLYVQGAYDNASGAATANLQVSSNGEFVRASSSIKYKTDVESIEYSYSERLLDCRPVWYRSNVDFDNPNHSWWGFIAEEVAEIDKRLVHWKTVEITYDESGSPVETPCEPEPEGVAYERFVPHLLNLIKRQKEQIEAMEARLSALEAL